MGKVFISHASGDDEFVRDLRTALSLHGQQGWIDSRELLGGDALWTTIQGAIEDTSAFVVVVSPNAFQSKWVAKELRHALDVQRRRGKDRYPVIPLCLDGTKLGVLEESFDEEPLHIPVSSKGVLAAMHPILVALGERLPTDLPPTPQPKAEPLEELVLELTDLKFHEQDGVRRASARARLVHEPATQKQEAVHTERSWRLIAPIGPIEANELRWYLEKYAVWPSLYFRDRAGAVERNLKVWGRLLHEAAMPAAHTANVMEAWARIDSHAGRRFSVHVDPAVEAGATENVVAEAREVATLLLGLPWELLYDGDGYLFQGATPTRVRRRLPNTREREIPVVATPIRILLVTARPEDEACGYLDHRASALPLVEAMESLPDQVTIHVVNPPTVPALRQELENAQRDRQPYHVIHFDGHGVFDRRVGLGGLCFEHPEDVGKLTQRRHLTVTTDDLGPMLRDHRIPLVFLEACQTAQAEQASESVASELLKGGVASVVAMSYSVLVETARRFVQAFYTALGSGTRVGDAMLAGQRQLKDEPFRGRVFGAGELRLDDWFVPVLFQEKDDPQLFTTTPARQTQEDFKKDLAARLGDVPDSPKTGFIGRSRELLALQRLLGDERYAVVRGQGGEGKTTLAAEFARWMVRSHQIHRAAFVSVETHSHVDAVLDALGRQLVGRDYSVATFENQEKALQPIERELVEHPTLLVVDNMESILLPPFLAEQTPDALSDEAREELAEVLALCKRLNATGDTRLVFTSREPLPAPFDAVRNRRELQQLDREDAVKLVERVLNASGSDAGASTDAAREEIEQLVEAVHGHARTLALLAPALQSRGVEATRHSLVELMAEMERRFPGSREHSVFASVELSLRRLSEANRQRARVLGVFHGAVDLDVLRRMMQWDEADVISLAVALVETGLATLNDYNHLTLNPALCPYLHAQLDPAELETLMARWGEAMRAYVVFLEGEQFKNIEVAATLTVLELPNFFVLLELVQQAGDPEQTIDLATRLYALLQNLGRPRVLERVGRVRDAASAALGDTWNHAQFEATRTRIEQLFASGQVREALGGAQLLLQRARAAGNDAYPNADFDIATACWFLARMLKETGDPDKALSLVDEAQQRFETRERRLPGRGAAHMAAACLTERADCLRDLGRLDEAATRYEQAIRLNEQEGRHRYVAVGRGQLGTVRMLQARYSEALAAHREAREWFEQLGELGSVATAWYQIGVVHQEANQLEAAEDAYRRALAIGVQLGNVVEQGNFLNQLGNVYSLLGRTEDAVAFYRQAVDKSVEAGDVAGEGRTRHNLARELRSLGRLDDARQEIRRAIRSDEKFGHAAQPWRKWEVLAGIEIAAGNLAEAEAAKHKTIDCYLAYRRDRGENHSRVGRISLAVTQSLLAGNVSEATALLQQLAADPDFARRRPFIQALQAIVAGSRDRRLAENSKFGYEVAAEILFLIETLEGTSS